MNHRRMINGLTDRCCLLLNLVISWLTIFMFTFILLAFPAKLGKYMDLPGEDFRISHTSPHSPLFHTHRGSGHDVCCLGSQLGDLELSGLLHSYRSRKKQSSFFSSGPTMWVYLISISAGRAQTVDIEFPNRQSPCNKNSLHVRSIVPLFEVGRHPRLVRIRRLQKPLVL